MARRHALRFLWLVELDVTRANARGDPWIACQPAGRIRFFSSRVKPRSGGCAALDLKNRIRRSLGKRFMVGFAPVALR
ncbi:hypothetical protein [Maricaulis maris]|jgi:hypothetical protein|uniref:hypothetical protein n=1 Tax=Maricaulis maris TaxID=74318 RepID=UPI002922E7DC|nr:hypothetical protein MACH15_29960 [Maricaulis maris]